MLLLSYCQQGSYNPLHQQPLLSTYQLSSGRVTTGDRAVCRKTPSGREQQAVSSLWASQQGGLQMCIDQAEQKPWAGGGDSTVTVSSSLQGEQQHITEPAGEKLWDEEKPVQARPEQPSPGRIAQPVLPASFWKGVTSAGYISHLGVHRP